MPPKKGKKKNKSEDPKKPPAFQKDIVSCSWHGPGPIYKLKPVVGYDDHCPSKYRNPAYSIAYRQKGEEEEECDTPGPKYYPKLPKVEGFSIGRSQRGEVPCGESPGPYMLPDPPRNPQFTLKWRTPLRQTVTAFTIYNLGGSLGGPSFSIMPRRPVDTSLESSPGPVGPLKLDMVKPRAPAYSLGFRQNADELICGGPGPYYPKLLDRGPSFSIGMKHNPCIHPNITECDRELC